MASNTFSPKTIATSKPPSHLNISAAITVWLLEMNYFDDNTALKECKLMCEEWLHQLTVFMYYIQLSNVTILCKR